MLRILCLAALLAAQGFAQKGTWAYEKSTTLSAAAETVTIHLPSTAARTVSFTAASVYCSVACTATLKRDGTAPTATAASSVAVNAGDATAYGSAVVPYYSSNVGTSTTVKTYTVPAGSEITVDLKDKALKPGENLTFVTSSITGDARIYFQWKEY